MVLVIHYGIPLADTGSDRLTLNDDDKRVREWFIEQTKLCGCTHKVRSALHERPTSL